MNSAWKDYSGGGNGGANTNYAFDQYDGDEKQSPSSLSHTSTIPLTTKLVSHGNGGNPGNHYAESRSLHRPSAAAAPPAATNGGGGRHMHSRPPPPPAHHHDRAAGTYSLPRPAQQPPHHNGYYTHRPPNRTGPQHPQQSAAAGAGDQLQPDFYFMPSQRKYSGEVVRVYVDYNTNPRK